MTEAELELVRARAFLTRNRDKEWLYRKLAEFGEPERVEQMGQVWGVAPEVLPLIKYWSVLCQKKNGRSSTR